MELSTRIIEAFAFATELHREQTRKGGGIPYLTHLMSASALVMEHGGDEHEAIAALLHDALEDQGQTYPGGADGLRLEIRQRFGGKVLAIVEACSDTDRQPKPPWRERKEAYIAHITAADPAAVRVSAADKLHNARSILMDYRLLGDDLWERFSADREQVLWYYHSLVDAFRSADAPPGLLQELHITVRELERLLGE